MGNVLMKIEAVCVQYVVVVVDCVRGCNAERVETLLDWAGMAGDIELDELCYRFVARIAFRRVSRIWR